MGAFDFSPYVGPAISILGGLFGGGSQVSPQATADAASSRQYLNNQAAVGQQYKTLSDYNNQNYMTDDPAMRTATQNEINYLGQDPNTSQADAQYLASAGAGQQAAYQQAGANLSASLGARGFTGDNSLLTGGLASIDQAQAAANANAANSLAQHQITQADQNRRGIISLQQGLDNTDYSRDTGALSAQNGIDSSLAGSYRSLASYEQGQQNAQNQQDSNLWGGIGTAVGGALDNSGNDLQDAQTALYNAQAEAIKNGQNPGAITPVNTGFSTGGTGGFNTTGTGGFGINTPGTGVYSLKQYKKTIGN